jgi:cobalt-zinc-cadmium efflux system membrane fusion protein
MATPQDGPPTHTGARVTERPGPGHFLCQHGPTLLVLLLMVALGVWGVRFDWKVPKFSSLWTKPAADTEEPGLTLSPESSGDDAVARAFERRSLEFPSIEAVTRAGIKATPATVRPFSQYVVANGTIDYDQNRIAHLASRAPGITWDVKKQVGQRVKKGDVLALIESADVGKAKADFLHYLVLVDIKKKIRDQMEPAVVPERKIQEAEADLREARIRLYNSQQTLINLGLPVTIEDLTSLSEKDLALRMRTLGLPAALASTLPLSETSTNLIPLLAPFDGTVIGRDIVKGEIVGPMGVQFTVADLSKMWILMDVRLEDAAVLRLHQPVRFVADGVTTLTATGELDWISTELEEKTRTVRARAEVANPNELLRARTFGTGSIRTRTVERGIAVPEDSVVEEDGHFIVFVRLSDTKFESRLVRTGIHEGKMIQIESGISPSDQVVTTGAHALKSEVLKGRIGSAE